METTSAAQERTIAAIVPCYNEATAIAKVVAELQAAVPGMAVYVYDNNSTDGTAKVAADAGAIVRTEELKGKGNVVRRAFADIEADIYLLIDGDDTYDTVNAPEMIERLIEGPYDHVLGVRTEDSDDSAYRPGHEAGNRWLNRIVGWIFGTDVGDMLSGYRVFSRRFVKSFPAVSKEFEIETELTIHCLALRVPQTSVPIGFRDRAEGSESKLRTYRDGSRILMLILNLTRHERPVAFYGALAGLSLLISLILLIPIIATFAQTGLVPRFPTLFLAFTLMMLAGLSMAAGIILDGIRKSRHELSRLAYLSLRGVR